MAKRPSRLSTDQAATLALEALGFLAAEPDAFDRFAGATGLDPGSLRARAGEPDFLASVLDFLLSDEALLLDFCDGASSDPQLVHLARHALGGP